MDKTDWKRHANPAVVNAFYSSLENSIQFPAGILQGIFFNQDRPSYMNYGSIGHCECFALMIYVICLYKSMLILPGPSEIT